jgi:hypothetical protein
MERITERQIDGMAERLTIALRENGTITAADTVDTFTPWSIRVWAIYDGAGRVVRTLDGVGGTRRELWNAGRAMLFGVYGY